jgi:hypothetical protein
MSTRAATAFATASLVLAACGRSAAPQRSDRHEDASLGECTDGLDNDADGLPDCDDPDCADAALCEPSTRPRVEWEPFDTDDLREGTHIVIRHAELRHTDLVLVLDDADRSSAALAALKAQLPSLHATLTTWRDPVPDWRLTVLTTEGSGAPLPLLDLPFADALTDPSTYAGWWTDLSTPDTPDHGLYAVLNAPPSVRREGVELHVLVVSTGDDEASDPATLHTGLARSLRTVRGGVVGGSLSAVVGPPGGCPDADEATAYLHAVEQLDGFTASICDADWPGIMQRFARIGTGQHVRVNVPTEVDPHTLRVWVEDGEFVYDGVWDEALSETSMLGPPSRNAKFLYTWNPLTHTVSFAGFAPSPGATVHVWWPDP